MLAFGFNPAAWRYAFRGLMVALKEYRTLARQNRRAGYPFRLHFSMPCLGDRYAPSGTASGHYFFQDCWVARKVYERHPVRHVDVGSRVDGFVAHVASFRDIEVFDIRPLTLDMPSIIFRQADLTRLPAAFKEYCDSLSCLHAIEHFGLGRYGDAIDLYGHVKGFENLSSVLQPGGTLYFSTPIGPERIDFNACRVFNIRTILDLAHSGFELVTFSYVDDAGNFHADAHLTPERVLDNCGCDYGCGIFEFRKKMREAIPE
jgi:SAM-dependent methyltransferase